MAKGFFTPCGLHVPHSSVLRDADEMAFVVITGNGHPGGTVNVVLEEGYAGHYLGPWPVIAQVEACADAWLAWHDERCDCRSWAVV